MLKLDINNSKELKAWELFYRRCKEIGINGLTQKTFLEKIKELSRPSVFEFSYKQPREKIFIGKKIFIVDIRSNPYVKKWFRPNDLIELGEKQGFKYCKYEYLGNSSYKRHKEEKNPKKAKREYQTYLLTSPNAKEQFKELYEQLDRHNQKVISMCYCNVLYCPKCGSKDIEKITTIYNEKQYRCKRKKCGFVGEKSVFNHREECHRFWLVELLKKQKRVDLHKKRVIDSKLEIEETRIEVLKV